METGIIPPRAIYVAFRFGRANPLDEPRECKEHKESETGACAVFALRIILGHQFGDHGPKLLLQRDKLAGGVAGAHQKHHVIPSEVEGSRALPTAHVNATYVGTAGRVLTAAGLDPPEEGQECLAFARYD